MLKTVESQYTLVYADEVKGFIQNSVYPYLCGYGKMPASIYFSIAFGLFLLGSLLPDIDSPNSILGKWIHLPFGHRTWLHSFWFLLPFLILSAVYPIAFYVALGIFIHLLLDSVSYMGVCWFKPVSGYRKYGDAKIKKGHRFKLYRNGSRAETFLVVCIMMLAVFMFSICVLKGIY